MKVKKTLALFLVIATAFFARFNGFYDKVLYYGDSSRDLLTTYKIVKWHEWVWHGPAASVTWNLLSPIYYYLMIPFYLISGWHPLTQVVLTSVLGIVTASLIFLCVKDLWGLKSAFASGLIYAVSAVVIPENLIGLNPGLVPPATILLVWSFIKVLNGKDNYLWITAATLAWAISFHASCFFIIPVLIILWFLNKPKISKKNLLLAGIVFLLVVVVPYGIQEKKHGGYNLITTYNYFFSKPAKENNQIHVSLDVSLKNYAIIIWKTPAEFLLPVSNNTLLTVSLILWLLAVYKLIKGWKQFDKNFKTIFLMLVSYTVIFGVAVKFPFPERPNWWFGNIFFPIFTIASGLLIAKLKNKLIFIAILLAVVTLNSSKTWQYKNNFDDVRFRQEKEIAEAILADAGNAKFNFFLLHRNYEDLGAEEPFVSLFWYYSEPKLKDDFFRWYNWKDQTATNPIYVITKASSPEFVQNKFEEYQRKYQLSNVTQIKTGNSYEIFKLSK